MGAFQEQCGIYNISLCMSKGEGIRHLISIQNLANTLASLAQDAESMSLISFPSIPTTSTVHPSVGGTGSGGRWEHLILNILIAICPAQFKKNTYIALKTILLQEKSSVVIFYLILDLVVLGCSTVNLNYSTKTVR